MIYSEGQRNICMQVHPANRRAQIAFEYVSVCALMFLSIAFLIFCLVGLVSPNWVINESLYVLILLFWFLSIIFCFTNITKHLLLFLFLGCFFSFLMARNFLTYIQTGVFNVFTKFHVIALNVQEYQLFAEIMFLSLFSLFFSYYFLSRDKRGEVKPKENVVLSVEKQQKFSVYHFLSKIGFFVCLPFQFYVNFVQMLQRRESSYVDSYVHQLSFPFFVRIFVALFFISFVLFLATKPKKREILLVFFVFFVTEGFIPLLGGARMEMAIIILFFIWYVNRFDSMQSRSDQKIFKKKYVVLTIIGGVVLIVLFAVVELLRTDRQVEFSLFDLINYFFDSLGGSDGVLANFIQLQDQFPKPGYVYFFNGIHRTFFDNSIVRGIVAFLSGTEALPIPSQGAEYLAQFDNFSHWLTSLVDYNRYIAGEGMGSAYMAETYFAFGFVGILLYGFLLGVIIFLLSRLDFSKHLWLNVFFMFICYQLFALPRSAPMSLLDNILYFIAGFILYFMAYKIIVKSNLLIYKNNKII